VEKQRAHHVIWSSSILRQKGFENGVGGNRTHRIRSSSLAHQVLQTSLSVDGAEQYVRFRKQEGCFDELTRVRFL
jgi:hypothetical protein